MSAKEYLANIRRYNNQVSMLKQRKLSIVETLTNIAPNYDSMPRSATRNVHKMEELICAKIDLDNEIAELTLAVELIMKTISSLPKADHCELLAERYANNQSWRSIAKILNLSESRVFHLHREALDELARQIKRDRKTVVNSS